jgi:pimeloyl-ACP methyl ester carboxylesterase
MDGFRVRIPSGGLRLAAALLTLVVLPPAALAAPYHRVIAYDHVRLDVIDQGRGPAIVMIPSLGRGAGDFDDLAARLVAHGYRVIRPQPRGFGGSVGPMTALTLHDLSADVAHVITGSGLKSAVVLGHDDGNRTARMAAADYPALIPTLILVGAGGKSPPDPEARAALRAVFDPSLSPEVHLRDVATGFFAPGHDPSPWRDGWNGAVALMEGEAGRAVPVADWWLGGKARILVIQGDQDRIAPPANAAILKADAPDRVTVIHIDGAGHALLPEQPAELANAILGYLKGR